MEIIVKVKRKNFLYKDHTGCNTKKVKGCYRKSGERKELMPLLDCTVTTCHFNVDERCSLDKIKVEGKNADTVTDTACGSFKARKDNRCMNVTGMPDARCAVDCAAEHCKYNESQKCQADSIGIKGSGACECYDTECGTFTCKC